jgi:uncharacterized protein YgiM (DUF1202 family)
LVKLLSTIGFFTGLTIGWNSTQNGWAALVCGVIIAGLGAFAGKVVHKLLVIAVSLLLAFGSAYMRHAVFKGLYKNGQQYSTSSPRTTYEKPDATPTRARVIAANANLRSKPGDGTGSGNRLVGTVALGQRLDVLAPKYVGKGWYHVRHLELGEGWVHGNDIEFE